MAKTFFEAHKELYDALKDLFNEAIKALKLDKLTKRVAKKVEKIFR